MEKKHTNNKTIHSSQNPLVEMLFTALYEMPKHILSQCASSETKSLEQKKMEQVSSH